VKRVSRRKKRAFRRARSSNTTLHWDYYKSLKKTARQTCHDAYNTYVRDMIGSSDPKKLYSFIKTKRSDSSGVSPLKRDGLSHSDSKVKAEILNDQFSSVFTHEDISTTPNKGQSPYPEMPPITVDNNGVCILLKELNPHKATGPDLLPAAFLKETASEIAPCLTLLFQASLNQGRCPSIWKQANISPIFKKGDRGKPSNYRPVSLTSICCKTLEHILHSNIMGHLDQHHILTDRQFGFRKRHSCDAQLILTIQDLASSLDSGQQIDAILLDFSKAFDKVPHQRLLHKARYYGLDPLSVSWIEDFLSGRSQRVIVEGQSSASAQVTSGVPQGTVLGPLLFLLYINDLPECVQSTARLFADDCLLYRVIRTVQDQRQLQEDLDHLQAWEADWLMEFNPDKCEVLRITNKRSPRPSSYSIHGHELRLEPAGKYLGVIIDGKLTWNQHVDSTCRKANGTLAFLRRNIKSCPRSVRNQAYTTLVRPILEYAGVVWDPHTQRNIAKLEAVQRRAARFAVGDYGQTSSVTGMLDELGWPTLEQRRKEAKLVMLYRVVHQLVAIPSTLLIPVSAATATTRGHPARFLLPHTRILAYQHSFFPSTIKLWNGLPATTVLVEGLVPFKAALSI
jgi:hypothetical protein